MKVGQRAKVGLSLIQSSAIFSDGSNDHVIVLEVGEYRCHSGFGRWGSMTPESFALHLRFKQSVPGSIYTT